VNRRDKKSREVNRREDSEVNRRDKKSREVNRSKDTEFNSSEDREFNSSEDREFNSSEDREFNSSEDREFNSSEDREVNTSEDREDNSSEDRDKSVNIEFKKEVSELQPHLNQTHNVDFETKIKPSRISPNHKFPLHSDEITRDDSQSDEITRDDSQSDDFQTFQQEYPSENEENEEIQKFSANLIKSVNLLPPTIEFNEDLNERDQTNDIVQETKKPDRSSQLDGPQLESTSENSKPVNEKTTEQHQ
jgi:hypothetical protein